MSTLTALYIHHLDPVILNIPNTVLAVRWYGLAYIAGFVLGYLVLLQLSKRELYCVPPKQLMDFVSAVCIFGVLLGGRLGEFFFYWLPEHGLSGLLDDPTWIFRVWEGGMASHGGLLAILTVSFIYARRHHLSTAAVNDGLVIVGPIGAFFGRIANFINGELYGRPCPADSPLAVKFPQELFELPPVERMHAIEAMEQISGTPLRSLAEDGRVQINVDQLMELTRSSEAARDTLAQYLTPRYPSQLFEALGEGLFIFIVLITLRLTWKKAPNGIFTAIFCILYAIARCVSECFKQPDAPTWGIITRGQYLSFIIAGIGIAFLIYALLQRKKTA